MIRAFWLFLNVERGVLLGPNRICSPSDWNKLNHKIKLNTINLVAFHTGQVDSLNGRPCANEIFFLSDSQHKLAASEIKTWSLQWSIHKALIFVQFISHENDILCSIPCARNPKPTTTFYGFQQKAKSLFWGWPTSDLGYIYMERSPPLRLHTDLLWGCILNWNPLLFQFSWSDQTQLFSASSL